MRPLTPRLGRLGCVCLGLRLSVRRAQGEPMEFGMRREMEQAGEAGRLVFGLGLFVLFELAGYRGGHWLLLWPLLGMDGGPREFVGCVMCPSSPLPASSTHQVSAATHVTTHNPWVAVGATVCPICLQDHWKAGDSRGGPQIQSVSASGWRVVLALDTR